MTTPEGRNKVAIKTLLSGHQQNGLYWWMPVVSGYGSSSLDFILCYKGRFAAIEAKAPGRSLTPRQELTAGSIRDAGGVVFEIDGPVGIEELKRWLEKCKRLPGAWSAAGTGP